jgi:hypothetical protein
VSLIDVQQKTIIHFFFQAKDGLLLVHVEIAAQPKRWIELLENGIPWWLSQKCEKSEPRKTSLVYGKQGACKIWLSFPGKLCGFFNRVAATGERRNIINDLIGFYLASDGMKKRGTVSVCGTQRTFQSAFIHMCPISLCLNDESFKF